MAYMSLEYLFKKMAHCTLFQDVYTLRKTEDNKGLSGCYG